MNSKQGALLAIADDLTGAFEVGAQLAAQGVRCAVSTTDCWPDGAESAVLNVATRHMDSEEASRAMNRLTRLARLRGIDRLYLKTDSTLRGRIAESFRAVLQEQADRSIVYVPAYPEMGRVVRNGMLYVNGKPLAETGFAEDLLNPVRESSIRAILEAASVSAVSLAKNGNLAQMLEGGPGRVVICDGDEEADLVRVASELRRLNDPYIAAGTAAFARYWAAAWNDSRPEFTFPRPKAASALAVVGSRHPAAIEQVDCAARLGTAVFEDDADAGRIAEEILNRRWAILRPSQQQRDSPLAVAWRCGRLASEVVRQSRPDALIIFGGDTAAATLCCLECFLAWPCGEVLPGIPSSLMEAAGRKSLLVTKAGGFGGASALYDIFRILGSSA